jgi:predicted transposase YdaD
MLGRYVNPYVRSSIFFVNRPAVSDSSLKCRKAKQNFFSPNERLSYERSLMVYRDLKNVIDTARDEGREEGREEGRANERAAIRAQMTAKGIALATIESILGPE